MSEAVLADADAACAREPIHSPGHIQPHGLLLILGPAPDHRILHASQNADLLLRSDLSVGARLVDALGGAGRVLGQRLASLPEAGASHHLAPITLAAAASADAITCHVTAHRGPEGLFVELEPGAEAASDDSRELYPLVRDFLDALETGAGMIELCHLAASEVRRVSGFDRALVYRFEPNWDGEVIAEDGNGALPSYLGLRFPASDIPAQARALYERNRLRLIADAHYQPVPLEPAISTVTGRSPDLSLCDLRSVSPTHTEYMRNMGTGSSMSVSLLREGRLWGLISCHGAAPRIVPPDIRQGCDLLGQLLSLQLAARERTAEAEQRASRRSTLGRLLAAVAAEESFASALVGRPADLLDLVAAGGAAVLTEGEVSCIGATPSPAELRALAAWLSAREQRELVAIDNLGREYPDADGWAGASGLLAVSTSQIHPFFVLWFRPELITTVRWAGDPHKPAMAGQAISPRRSFAAWRQLVKGRARPWLPLELDAARDLRGAIIGIVLRRAEERASMSEELERANRELESFSYSVSHDLRAPFRHIVGYAELLRDREGPALGPVARRYVDKVIEAGNAAARLIDDLLGFSRLGRTELTRVTVDMDRLIAETVRRLEPDSANRSVEWRVGPLGAVHGDPGLLRLAFENLLGNALKYTRGRDPAIIEVTAARAENEAVFRVRDNGAGFDMAYAGKLFGVFQRLHRAEEFEGTGIGLANVKRILDRHGGRVWAEGAVGEGATLFAALPIASPAAA